MKLAILGAGPGGYVAAIRAAQLGAKVTIIEDTEVGGTCLNRGCIPTKAMVASSEALSKARELDKFGIELRGELVPNLTRIIERKNKVVSTQVKGIRGLFKSWDITLKEGRGRLTSQKEIEVISKDGTTGTVEADTIIIATGSRPAAIPALPFDGNNIISSTEALELTEIPRSLLIVGAGAIGCEFACIYRELGSEVTIIEMLPRAVATEDIEISELLEKELKKKKIKLFTGIKIDKAEIKNNGVHIFLSDGKELIAEKVLVSAGRALNSGDIGLEAAGIKLGSRGEVLVNNKMETNIPGIYAVGDVTGGILLAHMASREGLVAAKNIMGINNAINYNVVPAAIFTSPEIASVGVREHQAAEKGIKYKTGHFQFRALGKAHAMGEIAGFVKLIAEESSDKLIGAHIMGPHASDLISEAALAMKTGLTIRDITDTIHAHPTMAEGFMEAAEELHGEAIHVPKK
ncbi:MAG: dihydrolipoyl dehydrogenase [Thermodesulfovibrionales bacterium]